MCFSLILHPFWFLWNPVVWVDSTIGGRVIPEVITSPVVSTPDALNIRHTKDFRIQGIDYLSRIWHNLSEFRVLNAIQLCTCLAFYFVLSERHRWVLCRRNVQLAYKIIRLVPLITNNTTVWCHCLWTFLLRGYHQPRWCSHEYQLYGNVHKFAVLKSVNYSKYKGLSYPRHRLP